MFADEPLQPYPIIDQADTGSQHGGSGQLCSSRFVDFEGVECPLTGWSAESLNENGYRMQVTRGIQRYGAGAALRTQDQVSGGDSRVRGAAIEPFLPSPAPIR